jgi:hypothetical protein
MGLPSPVPANLLSESMPAPVRMLDHQLAQPGKIRVEEVPTLAGDRFIHGMIMPWEEPLVQKKLGWRKLT